MPDAWPLLLAAGIGVLVLLVLVAVLGRYFTLWVRALVTRSYIGMPTLVFMSLRKVNPAAMVEARILATQAGLNDIPVEALEAHFLAGGDVKRVVRALIVAHQARIPLDWNTASAIDLAGRDVLEAVQMTVDPRVIDCPGNRIPGRTTLDAVAKDGIQLRVQARVTVRSNLAQLIGGAKEDTVIARVGEGIVSAIGSASSHKEVLANPALIARRVQSKGLDSNTSFEIVSIDIASIEVGENVGARLQVDQAEADTRVARARAEERRARAIATEQEMIALTAENRAHVVAAEAEVPRAQSEAIRAGVLHSHRGRKARLPARRGFARR